MEVVCFCNALWDISWKMKAETIKKLNLTLGHMHLASTKEQETLLSQIPKETHEELGGSGLNTLRTLKELGHEVNFFGVVGHDLWGKKISQKLKKLGMAYELTEDQSLPTGTSIILVSEDGQRTMHTHLGASSNFPEKFSNEEEILNSSQIIHITAYLLDSEPQKKKLFQAINFMKQKNKIISLDLADPWIASRHEKELKILLHQADILFANEAEQEAALKNFSPLPHQWLAIKQGEKGVTIGNKGETWRIPAPKNIQVVDTTAAGDLFAAGLLHGYLKNWTPEKAAECGVFLASDVIQHPGTSPSKEVIEKITTMG